MVTVDVVKATYRSKDILACWQLNTGRLSLNLLNYANETSAWNSRRNSVDQR